MNLHIVDVSSFLHCAVKSKHLRDTYVKGIPTKGMTYLLQHISRSAILDDPYILCFDSKHNFRKNLYNQYKSNRKFQPAVGIQADLLYHFLSEIGFTCLRIDGFEADDLIHSVIKSCEPFSSCVYDNIYIYSGDKDLSHNVYHHKIATRPVLTGGKYITYQNYKEVLSEENVTIPTGTISAYKVIYGDKSDNIPGFHNKQLFNRFLNDVVFSLDPYYEPNKLVNPTLLTSYFKLLLQRQVINEKDMQFLQRNIDLVYPVDLYMDNGKSISAKFMNAFKVLHKEDNKFQQYFTENNLDPNNVKDVFSYYKNAEDKINYSCFKTRNSFKDFNTKLLHDFLVILGDSKSLRNLGFSPNLKVEPNEEIMAILKGYATRYHSGEYLVDQVGTSISKAAAFENILSGSKLFK